MYRHLSLWLLCSLCVGAQAQTALSLDTLRIVGDRPAATATGEDDSRQEQQRQPGGVSVVGREQLNQGRAAQLSDALASTPGVYARSRYGQDETRLSIRGSGVSRNFNTRGVRLLRDGLPITEADGNTRTQLLAPNTADHLAVYRGANALSQGAATLGGAINMHSRTGRSDPGTRIRTDGGSFGYGRVQATAGMHNNAGADAWLGISGSVEDGYRTHSAQNNTRLHGNLGWQSGANQETRVYLDAQRSRLELPGALTRAEYLDNDRQANPDSQDADAARDLDLVRLSARHAIDLPGRDEWQLGVFVQDLRMDHPLAFAQIDSEQQDLGLSLRHDVFSSIAGRENHFRWGALAVAGQDNSIQDSNFSDEVTERDFFATTGEIYADNRWQWTSATALVTSVQALVARREVDERGGVRAHRSFHGVAPRLGLLHQRGPVQFYGNLSRAVEPPINGELLDDNDRLLRAQRAHTVEVGARGWDPRGEWEVTLYRSHLQREILLVTDPENPGDTLTSNAGRTLHQGLEAGGHRDVAVADAVALRLAGTWNWNDFRFRQDERWGNHQLPGIPEHEVRLAPSLRHDSGAFIGPVLDYRKGYPADFANSADAGTAVLWGVQAGYHSPAGWRLTVDARNLTDRRHINTVDVVDEVDDATAYINPGNGRALYAGVEARW